MNKKIEENYIKDINIEGITTDDYNIVRNKKFKDLGNSLKFYDKNVVDLLSFNKDGKTIRYFWYKHSTNYEENSSYNKNVTKPSSRNQLYTNREPFEIEPWNQILIDESVKYGMKIDDNIESFFEGGDDIMTETKLSIDTFKRNNLVWVARSVMVCHPEGYVYGEIDEILYSPLEDTYYVGDTKTSSSVKKIGYAYQLGVYIEILRLLNPDKKISPIGLINHVKIKSTKWKMNNGWEQVYKLQNGEEPPLNVKGILKDHPIYKAKWNDKIDIKEEFTQGLIKFDVDKLQITNLIQAEIYLIYTLLPRYKYFAHSSSLKKAASENENIKKFDDDLQQKFNQLKEQF